MRIAVIDVGSNSIRLAVVEVDEQGRHQTVARERAVVKLGRGLGNSGEIAPDAYQAGLEALARMADLVQAKGCDRLLACGTAALRDAANARDFIEDAEALGVPIRVISGEEQARLMYEAVAHEIPFPSEPVVLLDVGGASTQLVWVAEWSVLASVSLPWGVQRLSDAMATADPPLPRDLVHVRKFIRKTLKKAGKQLPEGLPPVGTVLGASGTLTDMAKGAGGGTEFTLDQMLAHARRLWRISTQARAEQMGADPKRAESMHVGASWILGLMRWLGAERIQCLPVGLRDGLVWEAMGMGGAPVPDLAARRRAGVEALAERLDTDPAHSRHVTTLAGMLFHYLERCFGLGDPERELLGYAARLHDVGLSVADKGHHKLGAYLVQNADLPGFWPHEKAILSQVVRFHRGKAPRKAGDPAFDLLPPWHQQTVEKLVAILRVADSLDHSRRQAVRSLRLLAEGDQADLVLEGEGDLTPELEAVQDKGRLLWRLIDRPVRVVVA